MRYLCLLIFGMLFFNVNATTLPIQLPETYCTSDTLLPKVFMIGEYEAQFERLMQEHSTLLMTACNDDMNIAFEKWQSMLEAMETHSDVVNYDLKGVKIWLNVFWEEDGGIKHITYHLKPNSRNVDTDKLTLFFISFVNNYRFPLVVGEKFSHYGMASFPTFVRKPKKRESGSTPLVKDSTRSPNNNHEK